MTGPGGPPPPRRRFMRSLTSQLIAVLTVALLPLGLISLYQTSEVLEETRALSETALLGQTERAAERERTLIEGAFGAAAAAGAALLELRRGGDACGPMLARLVETGPRFVHAAFIGPDGATICSSDGQPASLGDTERYETYRASPRRVVEIEAGAPEGGPPVLTVGVPLVAGTSFLGYVTIGVPHAVAGPLNEETDRQAELLTFSAEGTILSAGPGLGDIARTLPAAHELAWYFGGAPRAFLGRNTLGEERVFAVVPIVDDTVYALGSWPPERSLNGAMALVFPLLMWIVSIFVAYFGLNRLVIRHVRRLQRRMRLYSAGHHEFGTVRLDRAPEELDEVAATFNTMTRTLNENERRREEDLQEKTVLLKEVHHRVKNNLQLISSIMNMQIRAAATDEARRVLRRVQDRVMGLATIHRYLYTARNLGTVRADTLLREIINQLGVVGSGGGEAAVRISEHLDPVEITPDQSVPLSLLATEAATNAVKYVGRPRDEDPWISLVLKDLGGRKAVLSIVNSLGDPVHDALEDNGSGLGSRLIESFVTQLGGTLETEAGTDRFGIHVSFEIAEFDPEKEAVPLPEA